MTLNPAYDYCGVTIYQGDAKSVLQQLPAASVNCCITSPPYFGLRDYGTATWEGGDPLCSHTTGFKASASTLEGGKSTIEAAGAIERARCGKCGAIRIDQQIGLETTLKEYVCNLVGVFEEVRRALRDDAVCWLNLGDSYAGSTQTGGTNNKEGSAKRLGRMEHASPLDTEVKPKNLLGVPWRVAFALQEAGWWLRSDCIWCLSGGTWVYVKTQKGEMPMRIQDMARLKPETVQLWNGEKWTRLLGVSKSARRGDELELVLRSGERISCTQTHKFPTNRGLLAASELRVGDTLEYCRLPEPSSVKDCLLNEEAAWFAGLYIAEGSRSKDCIQISGHADEEERWIRVQRVARLYGGSATRTIDGNSMDIRVYGKILSALLDELVSGKTAHDKGFGPVVWRYSNVFLSSMVQGYLDGDGHKDEKNRRWRIGFCRNYKLERDLRTACARLGYTLTLNLSSVPYNGKQVPTFRGELRMTRSGHYNERDMGQIVAIRKARCMHVYDLGVEDEPHLFSLASGVLTHNSKPNCMPSSVTDRPTTSHEYVFLLSKSARYYYDAEAIKEPAIAAGESRGGGKKYSDRAQDNGIGGAHNLDKYGMTPDTRNCRTVWDIPTQPTPDAHFATYPQELVRRCLLSGCPAEGTAIDPFFGSGTTGIVARKFGRRCIGIELNPCYIEIARKRLAQGDLFMEADET